MRTQAAYYRHLAEAAFQKLQALTASKDEGAVLARVTIGRVAPEILRAAWASRADLVVVGAQPRSRLGRRLFGVKRRLSEEAPTGCRVRRLAANCAGSSSGCQRLRHPDASMVRVSGLIVAHDASRSDQHVLNGAAQRTGISGP